jgi:hypothetical protein
MIVFTYNDTVELGSTHERFDKTCRKYFGILTLKRTGTFRFIIF